MFYYNLLRMKTTVTPLESLARELSVEIPIAEFNQKVDKVINDLRGKVKIDGFRQGKVPLNIIKNKYGTNAKTDAANEVVSEVLPQAFEAEKLYPAGQPELTKIDFEGSEHFSFTVTFEVFPEVTINDLSTLEITQQTGEITEDDKEHTLQGLKEQAATFNSVERPSASGDKVKINFEGFVDGEAFEGGKAEGFDLVLGKNTMIPGFEDALIGKKAGEEFEFNVHFPTEYNAKHLAGKEATFKINMIEVNETQYPEVDAEFAQKFGKESTEELLAGIAEQMQMQLDEKLEFVNKNLVFDALLASHELEVPKASVQSEAQNLLADMQNRMKEQGLPENNAITPELFTDEATKRVKLGLLVNTITTEHNITASDEAVDAKLAQMSQSFGDNAQGMIDYYKANADALEGVKSMVVEAQVAQFIADQANVTVEEKPFSEIVATNQ